MEFRKLEIGDRARYEAYLNASNPVNDSYIASELNFSNLFCWNVSDNIGVCFSDEAVYIRSDTGGGSYFLPPLVTRTEEFYPALLTIEAYCAAEKIPFQARSLTREMLDVLTEEQKARYEITYNRDYSEYLYAPQDLIELSGRKFAQKRNHLNYFFQNYAYTFRPYREDDRQNLVNLVQEWKAATGNTESLEDVAIDNAIAYYREIGLLCDVLEVDGKLVAFSIGFINRNNVAIVMFEKADTAYRGSFNAINQLFVKDRFSGCRYVNRQEDMGIEGLRRAKLGYNPVAMADKFDIIRKG